MKKQAEDASKEVVYSVPWQTLRVQLLAKNSPEGGFDTLEGVRSNISKLKKYVGNMNDINKVYRALNLLNAARMGYASKDEIGTPKDKALVKFRDDLDEAYEELKEKGKVLTPDSSAQIAKDIKSAPVDWLIEVERDLKARMRESDPEKEHAALDNFLGVVQKEVAKHEPKASSLVANLKRLAENLNSM